MMARRGRFVAGCGAAGFLAAIVLAAAPVPASASGLFESFFGSLSRALSGTPQRQARAYADHYATQRTLRDERIIRHGPAGPRQAFCVRTCDGGFFPVRAHAGLSVADACRSFCPGCDTQLFYGSVIDHAVARDGSRYADLPNAYLYRKQLVDGCNCNGRKSAGVASLPPKSDPTLRRGDVIATANGLMVYNGSGNRTADFTPAESYPGFSKRMRAELSEIEVTPPARRGAVTTPSAATSWAADRNQSAWLER